MHSLLADKFDLKEVQAVLVDGTAEQRAEMAERLNQAWAGLPPYDCSLTASKQSGAIFIRVPEPKPRTADPDEIEEEAKAHPEAFPGLQAVPERAPWNAWSNVDQRSQPVVAFCVCFRILRCLCSSRLGSIRPCLWQSVRMATNLATDGFCWPTAVLPEPEVCHYTLPIMWSSFACYLLD